MKVGLSVSSFIPDLAGPDLLAGITARAAAARQAGLSSLHVGDRHGVNGPHAANIALTARLSAHWDGPLGVLVVSSMWNPVLLAEQLSTLASTAAEGLTVVVALGEGPAHFASVGVNHEERVALFVDGLAVTRALLNGEMVTARVGPYKIKNARVSPGTKHDISWLVGATAPKAIRRAVTIADGWLASAKLTPSEARERLDIYRGAGGQGPAVLRREVYVGSSGSDVAARTARFLSKGYRNYPGEALIAGDVGQVREWFDDIAGWGFDEVLVRSLANNQTPALASIERLGQAIS